MQDVGHPQDPHDTVPALRQRPGREGQSDFDGCSPLLCREVPEGLGCAPPTDSVRAEIHGKQEHRFYSKSPNVGAGSMPARRHPVSPPKTRQTLKATQKRSKRDYDLRTRRREYQVGQWVYVLDTAHIKGRCKKLSPPWRGPARIVEKLSPNNYRVAYRRAVVTLHHDKLKPCTDREDRGAPRSPEAELRGTKEEVFCTVTNGIMGGAWR